MKINFIVHEKVISGGTRVVFEYMKRLRDRGHETRLIYPRYAYQPSRPWSATPREIARTLKHLVKPTSVSWFEKTFELPIPFFAKTIMDHWIPDADVSIATSFESVFPLMDLPPSKGHKLHFVQHYEAWNLWNDPESWNGVDMEDEFFLLNMADQNPKNVTTANQKKIVDQAMNMPTGKITISRWLNDLIESRFNQKPLATIINGINLETFYLERPRINRETVTVLFPYRNIIWKGIDDALHALQIAKARFPQLRVTSFGIKKPVDLPKWIHFEVGDSDDVLRKLYNDADIFLLSSWVEGCTLTPMEAMACECAIVTTRCGGPMDYGVHQKNALISKPRDYKTLASNLCLLIENASLRKSLARSGWETMQKQTWENCVNEFESTLFAQLKQS